MYQTEIGAFVSGTAVPMRLVPDETFSQNIMGDGVAIQPRDCIFVAPFDGEVTAIAKSYHAFCLKGEGGIEVLVHIGLDTVKLAGEGFTCFVQKGDRVKRGDRIIQIDDAVMKNNEVDWISPCVVLSSDQISNIDHDYGNVVAGRSTIMICHHETITNES